MTAINGNRCGTGTVVLSTTGCTGTVNWFAAATGGASIGTGVSFTTPSISTTTTYYAECTASGCVFPRVAVIATVNPLPSSTFTASPANICAGVNTTITYTGTVIAGQTYSWNFAGGTVVSGSGQGPYVVNWPNPAGGTYNVTLTVTSPAPASCSSVVTTQPVVVSPGPTLTINPAAPSYCAPGSVLLTGNVVLNPATYNTPGVNAADIAIPNNGVGGVGWNGTTGTFATNNIVMSGLTPTGTTLTSVCLNINHERASDVAVYLVNPCGGTVRLILSAGGTGTTGFNTTCFTPAAANVIGSAGNNTVPFNGTYAPQGGWGTFLSSCPNMNGTWSIRVGDTAGGAFPSNIGTLTNWALNFSSTNSVVSYTWSPSTNLSSTNTASTTASPNATTTYTLTVTDALGCPATKPVTVTVGSITALATTSVNPSCGATNGSITIGAVTGGTPAYTYSFNGSAFTSTTSYPNLAAGTYTIDVKDANGCVFTKSVTLITAAAPTNIVITKVDAKCGASNGSVNLGAVTGGVSPYTYSFNVPAGAGPYTSTTSYTGLAAGTYNVEVKDASGCLYLTTVTIIDTPGPTGIVKNIINAICGGTTGSINLGAVTGGVGPFTYSFNVPAGAGPYTTTTSHPNLPAGTYAIEVKDANGCIYTTSATIIDVPGPTAIATTIVNSSCGASDGSVTITGVTGGVAAYTYAFAGSGSYTATTTYGGLSAGSYAISVKDANGCIYNTSISIVDNAGPTAIATTLVPSKCGAANGSITIGAITGGVTPYTYSINGGGYTTTTTYSSLAAGTYTISVKDANGCIFTTPVTIIDNPGPTNVATTLVPASCGNSSGSVTLGSVTGGTALIPIHLM